MSRFARLEVLNEVLRIGLLPLFYERQTESARKAVDACLDGGARLVEFTNRGDFAVRVFSELAERLEQEKSPVILGAGTIDDAPTAAQYIANGANFIVGPTFNPELARLCNRRKIAYFPGCATVTEIAIAEEWGVEICKIFPGQEVGGPNFIKAVHGPRPWSRLMPTGGVSPTQESITAWIKAGAAVVGLGSNLISKSRLQNGDYPAITQDVQQVLIWIDIARSGTSP
jgi:2-dehydro-3-deoxyphosphogluconate aldolase / (4S)-4-hydroxy-2-oxoglutarate aldolase